MHSISNAEQYRWSPILWSFILFIVFDEDKFLSHHFLCFPSLRSGGFPSQIIFRSYPCSHPQTQQRF